MSSGHKHAALWIASAVMFSVSVLWLGSDNGGADVAAYWLGPQGPVMATSFGYKLLNCVLGSVVLRVTLNGLDKATGINFRKIINTAEGASNVQPVLMYAGLRIVGFCIMFGYILSS